MHVTVHVAYMCGVYVGTCHAPAVYSAGGVCSVMWQYVQAVSTHVGMCVHDHAYSVLACMNSTCMQCMYGTRACTIIWHIYICVCDVPQYCVSRDSPSGPGPGSAGGPGPRRGAIV